MSDRSRRGRRRSGAIAAAVLLLAMVGCGLALEEQKTHIREGRVGFPGLSSRAFVESWGAPTYRHEERTQFFSVGQGRYIPRFRVPIGEAPPDWDSRVISDHAVFFAYVDRGELLGFVDDRLISREQLPAQQLHDIGKAWEKESLFKTRLETLPSADPVR